MPEQLLTPPRGAVFARKEFGDFTRDHTADLGTEVRERLATGFTLFVFDVREVGYIDSYGLGAIVRVAKQAREAGARFVVVGLNEDLTALFALLKLDQVVECYAETTWRLAGGEL